MIRAFAALLAIAASPAPAQSPPLERIQLPPGFRIEVLAAVPNARALAMGAKGTLFVGSRSGGAVHAVLQGGRVVKLADGRLYVPIGAPCNICDRDGYALIGRLDVVQKTFEPYAKGIRNTVGFDWHPATRELWFTDNGRDWLGDELPADELNHAPRAGMHFGFPHCHQGDLPDPEFGRGRKCAEFQAPARKLGPHVASLGMRFYTGAMFPDEYRNQVFIAEHGSWNRSSKVGYRISVVTIEGNKAVSYQPFAQGWLQGESAWGRPVDVEVLPDGSLAVSDDFAGMIYRISYSGPR